MEYYGNNDWRNYLHRQNELVHFGIPRRSGRFPWGSGEDPYHHGADAPGGRRKKYNEIQLRNEREGITRARKGLEEIENNSSQKKVSKTVWGRDKELSINYDVYSNEKVTDKQKAAAKEILSNKEFFKEAKSALERYCKDDIKNDPDNKANMDNIFSYINPKSIYVTREREGKDPIVGLMCNYRYDPEHGLVVMYKDGKYIVGMQDIIL